jgi:hypothetical protein
MNAQAINSAGAASRNAQQSAGNALAGQGIEGIGGNSSGLVSGIQQQIQGTVASQSANQLASAQNQIVQANYETGRENFWNSTKGEQSLANAENPEPYGSMAQSSLGQAQASAAEIDRQKQARTDSWAGLAKGVIGAGLNVATGGASGLASKALKFAKNFFPSPGGNSGQADDGSGA